MKNNRLFYVFMMISLVLFGTLLTGSITTDANTSIAQNEQSCSDQARSFIGNPAASYCVDVMGYEYKIAVQDDGSEKGQCIMPTGDVCDQWEFYAGQCGVEHSYCTEVGLTLETRSDGLDPYSPTYAVCLDENGRSQMQVSELIQFEIKPLDVPTHENDLRSDVTPHLSESTIASLPSHFDWRDINGDDWMSPVKDQGPCGSCWAFSAVGIVETYYNFLHDQPNLNLDFSEENLVSDCFLPWDCSGGHSHDSLAYIRDTGIVDEQCMPYTATNSSCSTMCQNPTRYTIDHYATAFYALDVTTLKYFLVNNGPVSVYLKMDGVFGSDGIYRCGDLDDWDINHAVIVVGYNDPGQYWIVKNSWGTNTYGHDQGYFKVGYNQCNINTTFYAYIPKPTSNEINIAVTTPGWDNIGAILTNMGYSYTQISDSDLTSYININQYDVIFANCNGSAGNYAPSAANALRQFVQNGGSLYASDYAFAYVQHAFPGHINFFDPPYVGQSGEVTANIVDQGLANYLNPANPPSTIELDYDLGGWVPIDSVASGTTVHLRGSFPSVNGQQTNKPLVASFNPYTTSNGRVIYTSFHNEPQLTNLQERLLEYLVLIPKTSDIVNQAENLVESQGVYVKQTNINTINPGQTSARFSYNLTEQSKLVFGINWAGSALRLSVFRPNGSFYGQVEGSSPPYLINIENAEPGQWQFEVVGIDVPSNNYPYVVVIGDELRETGEQTLFLPLIINGTTSGFNIKPVITAPADGAQLSVEQPTLTWQLNPNVDPGAWFMYWISSNPNVSTSNYAFSGWANADAGSTLAIGLEPNKTYYWIAAYDYFTPEIGWRVGPTTAVRNFTTGSDNAIPMPDLLSPADGSQVTLIPTITWQVDPIMMSSNCNFAYWYSTTDSFDDWVYGSAWPGAGASTLQENLQENTPYYWMAQYICYSGYPEYNQYRGPATPVRTLTTGSGYTILPGPNLIAPADGATINTLPLTFSWHPVSGATEYQIRLYGFWGPYSFTTQNTSIVEYWLNSETEHHWEVRARNNQAWGDWSVQRSFTTGDLDGSALTEQDAATYQKHFESDSGWFLLNPDTPVQMHRESIMPEQPIQD